MVLGVAEKCRRQRVPPNARTGGREDPLPQGSPGVVGDPQPPVGPWGEGHTDMRQSGVHEPGTPGPCNPTAQKEEERGARVNAVLRDGRAEGPVRMLALERETAERLRIRHGPT